MALYNDLAKENIFGWAYDVLKQGMVHQRDADGKLELNEAHLAWDVPWHHTVMDSDLNCFLWNRIMFTHLFKRLPHYFTGGRQYVPSQCMGCFKVVARPTTIKQLFAVVDLQKRLGRASKCGIELRPYVFGNYGGYFYNRGLKEGIERFKEVRTAVDADPVLGPAVKVILKRACTEMEHNVGPSDKWELTPEQIEVEKVITSSMNCDLVKRRQSEMSVKYVHSKWIEHAYSIGDETVFEYLDSEKPMYKPLVTYHHLADEKEIENVADANAESPDQKNDQE